MLDDFNWAVAGLLEYPNEDWFDRLGVAIQAVNGEQPEEAEQFAEFARGVAPLTIAGLQELYTQTFDLNPVCTLDVGYHVFGENYKRGELLANLRQTEAPHELGQARQLPDYLPVLLRLVTKLDDPGLRQALIAEILIPGLNKMREALAKTENPYRILIEIIWRALTREVSEAALLNARANACGGADVYQISPRTLVRS
jgi:nitrate reductase delta subunit